MKIKIRNKNRQRIIRHEQWIEIKRVDGKTVTVFYPPNDIFDRELKEMDPQPDILYRRFNFVHGVPQEYMWAKPPLQVQKYGGLFLHRFAVEDWPVVFNKERENADGLATPSPRPLGRPEELGPCPCERCTERRDKGLPSRFAR
jgi:hypothetical protein